MHARLRSYMRRELSCEPQVSFQKDLILSLLPGHFAWVFQLSISLSISLSPHAHTLAYVQTAERENLYEHKVWFA